MNDTLTTRTDADVAPETEQSGPTGRSRTRCTECEGPVRPDEERGELVCENCGLVLEADQIDRGPEWRSFEGEDGDDRSRVGAPVSELLHDRGLSTTIDWRDEDAYGNTLSARKQSQMQRLRTWDQRFSAKDSAERNLKQALGEIKRMAAALGLPKSCQETAGAVYRRAVDEGLLPGRSIESMASASLCVGARQHGTPRTFDDVAAVSRVDQLAIERAYRYLSRELDLAIEPADPDQYLPQYASALEVSDEAEGIAREILAAAKGRGVHVGKHPAGLAASALYAASRLANERLTQAEVAASTSISEVTIRKRYRELLEVYGEHGSE